MKNTIIKLSGLFLLFLLWSCENDLENVSRITYFPTFDFKGEKVIMHELGTPFTDPGCTAEEDGTSLTVDVSVVEEYSGSKGTTVDVNKPGKYVITYSALNSDGFPGTEDRIVYVFKNGDFINSIEGLYTSTVVRNGKPGAQYTDMEYIIISKGSSDKIFNLSCGIGGYYAIGRNYGAGYLAPAEITANDIASNNFSIPDYTVNTFGGVVTMSSFTVDPTTKTISFVSDWDSGFKFEVTLVQVQ